MPKFEDTPHPSRGIDRDLNQQIAHAYLLGVNRIISIAADMSDEITLAVDNGDMEKAKALTPFSIHLKDWISKNIKLKTKMLSHGLGD